MSAVTHIATVKNIELWQEGSKYVLNFTEPAKEIGPIKLVPKPNGTVSCLQVGETAAVRRTADGS